MDFSKHLQSEGDLGIKMKKAFNHVLQIHSKAVIIGSDCPEISSEIIEDAFKKLDEFDCVIGPTTDGGYYLLGMKKFNPLLFENIEWSTDKVFKQTQMKLNEAQQNYSLLVTLTDVDTIDDLMKFPNLYEDLINPPTNPI